MGRIYNIGDDFGHVVDRQLAKVSQLCFCRYHQLRHRQTSTWSDQDDRAQDTGAQYIIGGDITDLTATIESKLLKDDIINRQFALEMQVFDGKTGLKSTPVAIIEVAK